MIAPNSHALPGRSTRRAAALAAVIAFVILALPGESRAAPIVDFPCAIPNGFNWDRLDGIAGTVWALDDACPEAIILNQIYPTTPGKWGGIYERRNDGAPIESITMKLVGSSGESVGVRQGLMACSSVCDYSKLVTIEGENVTEPQEIVMTPENGLIPEDATRVVIVGDCIWSEPCPIAGPLEIRDLTIYRDDPTPPVITGSTGGFEYENDRVFYDFQSYDVGSGVASTWVTINGSPEPYFSCVSGLDDWGYPICEEDDLGKQYWLYFSALQQGMNSITLTAVNGVGISASVTLELFLDSLAPAQPDDLTLTPNRNGYVSSRSALLAWENPGETTPTETESGIVGAYIDLDTANTTFDPPEHLHEGDNISSVGLSFPIAGEWDITIETVDAEGHRSPPATITITIDDKLLQPPVIAPIAPVNLDDIASGRTFSWTQAGSPLSGICGSAVAFNASPSFNPGEDPDSPTVAGTTKSLTLNGTAVSNLPEGSIYMHVRSFTCSGVPGEIAHRPMLVDLHPPQVTAFPTSGWLADDTTVQLEADDVGPGSSGSGIDEIWFGIDGPPTTSVDGAEASVSVPDGVHELTFYAVDAAGNPSEPTTITTKVDRAAPSAAFEPVDANDPTRVRVQVGDSDSGVSGAWVEMRPIGGGWRQVGDALDVESPVPGFKTLEVAIPDDGQIAPGEYELRVIAQDAAGRRTQSSLRLDGSSAGFRSPIRVGPKLKFSVAGSSSALNNLGELLVDYGQTAVVGGRLSDQEGRPIASARVRVLEEVTGAIGRDVAELVTDADGRFAVRAAAGPSRTFTATFAGNAVLRPVSAEVQLLTRAKVRLSPKRATVKSNRYLLIRGKVDDFGVGQPAQGKRVIIQLRGSRGWSAGKELRASDDGRFVYRFRHRLRARAGRKPVRFQIRAVVPTEGLWPFEVGTSRAATVVVKR